jgi:hypothetical protein
MAGIEPRALKEGLVARLAAEGFELCGAWMRRPLREQNPLRCVERNARLSLSSTSLSLISVASSLTYTFLQLFCAAG